jgi:hypothetical protein
MFGCHFFGNLGPRSFGSGSGVGSGPFRGIIRVGVGDRKENFGVIKEKAPANWGGSVAWRTTKRSIEGRGPRVNRNVDDVGHAVNRD